MERPLKRTFAFGAGVLLIALTAGAASAHHSFSMFDSGKTETIIGTVKSFDMVNPHSWLQVVAPAADGAQVEWSLEMGGPAQIQHEGWSQTSVQPGDKVTVRMHPLRDGSHGGQLVSAVLSSGQTLNGGGPPGPQASAGGR